MRWGKSNKSFLDLIMNLLMGILVLLTIAILNITVEKNKANVQMKAEMVMTVSWETEFNHDVDTWIETPNESLLWFRHKEVDGFLHIDRDDMGHTQDSHMLRDGTVIPNINQEIVTWRGMEPGEYIINLHLYRTAESTQAGYGKPAHVRVTLIKLNPQAQIVFEKVIILNKKGQQETVARVVIGNDGEIRSVEDGPSKDLVGNHIEETIGSYEP
jgi:hypothetical protein